MKTNEVIQNLKEKILKLEDLEAAATIAEMAYDKDPENEATERAFDEAYKKEYAAFMDVSTLLVDLLEIDIATARAMVNYKRTALLSILGAE